MTDPNTLQREFFNLFESAVAILMHQQIPTAKKRIWTDSGGRWARLEERQLPTFEALIESHDEAIRRTESWQRLHALLVAEPAFAKRAPEFVVGPQSNALPAAAWVFLKRFLVELLKRTGNLCVDRNQFNAFYSDISHYLFGETNLVRVETLLLRLRSERPRIELSQSLWIERIRPARAAELEEHLRINRGDNYVPDTEHILVQIIPQSRGTQASTAEDWQTWFDKIDSTITTTIQTLRIVSRGNVRAPYSIETAATWSPGSSINTTIRKLGSHASAHEYNLTEEGILLFLKLHPLVQESLAKREKGVAMAVRRFSTAIEEQAADDKMIDLMIAAEALFLFDSTTEPTYRFSQRFAAFLEESLDARLELLEFGQEAYALRSQLMHGKIPQDTIKIRGQKVPFADFVERVESLMRRALQKVLLMKPEERPARQERYWDKLLLS